MKRLQAGRDHGFALEVIHRFRMITREVVE